MVWLPRLLLVLCNVFLKLGIVPCVVFFLTIVIAGDPAQFSTNPNRSVGCIDIGDWGRNRVSSSLITGISLLFLFSSFLVRNFSTLGIIRRGCFLSLDLGFFNPRVFHRAARGTNFCYSNICWSRTSRTVLIYFSSNCTRPE